MTKDEPTTNVRVALFENAYGTEPAEVELASIISDIRGQKYARQIQRARKLFGEWKDVCPGLDSKKSPQGSAYEDFKRSLPAFCMSGTATSRTEPREHSGLLQVDCDRLNGRLDTLRQQIKSDPHVAFGFVSPSGDGLKLGLRIDGRRHMESFLAAEIYFRDRYGVRIDPAVKDRLRLCFVSHDPEAWTNGAAELLPLRNPIAREDDSSGLDTGTNKSAMLGGFILPSGKVTISESARAIFSCIRPRRTLFCRGGALVELIETNGSSSLEIYRPEKFRSDVEKHGRLFAWRFGRGGKPVLKPSKMSLDDAKAILAAQEARELLPPVASVVRCPILIETNSAAVTILGRGYHAERGGLLIVAGDVPPQVSLAEAVKGLLWLVDEVSFQSEADRSRALAAFITPALRLGGLISGSIPVDCAEADQSQSGKGYRHSLVCALYNEASYFVTSKVGGVGSVDESFAAALMSGRPFICLDNFRGRMDSQNLEAFLTCPSLFPCRIPHRGEVLIDPRNFILQMSSNGLETTRDLANRASICRIQKRPGFAYRDTLGELRRRQSYYLGCVFAVIVEWIANGKPRTNDTRHDFREWSQTLDWICRHVLGCAPLMDGHQAAQERTSNPALTWLRSVALAITAENRLRTALIASELVELCEVHDVEIPGKPADEERAKRQVGILCKRLFGEGNTINVDGFAVTRGRKEYRKPSGDMDFTHAYTFAK